MIRGFDVLRVYPILTHYLGNVVLYRLASPFNFLALVIYAICAGKYTQCIKADVSPRVLVLFMAVNDT